MNRSKSSFAIAALALTSLLPSAQASTLYWGGSTGFWNVAGNWSTSPTVPTAPGSFPVAADDAIFNMTTATAADTIGLQANQAVNSMTFNSPGSTQLLGSGTSGNGTARVLTIGAGGITLAAGSGGAQFGTSGNTVTTTLNGSQTWVNHSANALTISNATQNTLATPATLTLTGDNAGAINFTNSIADSASGGVVTLVVAMTGSGGVSLGANASTFSGGLTVQAGSVSGRFISVFNTGQAGLVLGDTAANSNNVSFALSTGGTTSLPISTAAGTTGTMTFSNGNNVASIFNGGVVLNNTNSKLLLSQGTGTASQTFAGVISGAGGLANTAGRLTLSGDNTFAGGLTLNSGILDLRSQGTSTTNSALGTGTFTIGGGTLDAGGSALDFSATTNNALAINANFIFTGTSNLNLGTGAVSTGAGGTRTITANASTLTIGGAIADGTAATGITKGGAGTLALGGTSTYTGATTINGGTLSVASLANGGTASAVGASSNAAANLVIGNGATLQYTGGATTSNRNFTINGATAAIDASGTGALTLANTASPAYGTSGQVRSLTLTGTSTQANTLFATLTNNGAGVLSLAKTGPGTWVLSGTNTFTGGTTISGGTLSILGSIGTASISGGTLSGTGATGALTLLSGGTIAPGVGLPTGDLTASSLSFQAGADLSFTLDPTSLAASSLLLSGGFTKAVGVGAYEINLLAASPLLTAGSYDLVSFASTDFVLSDFVLATAPSLGAGLGGSLVLTGSELEYVVVAVPEPSTYALLAGGLGLMVVSAAKRRRSNGV